MRLCMGKYILIVCDIFRESLNYIKHTVQINFWFLDLKLRGKKGLKGA